MSNSSKKLTVTAVKHDNSGFITAFFNELPGLVVQGSDDDDVIDKLDSLLKSYIKRLGSVNKNFDIKMRAFA